MTAPKEETAPAPNKDDCAHIIHEWPVTGPWVDYTCANCEKTWRLPLAAAYG